MPAIGVARSRGYQSPSPAEAVGVGMACAEKVAFRQCCGVGVGLGAHGFGVAGGYQTPSSGRQAARHRGYRRSESVGPQRMEGVPNSESRRRGGKWLQGGTKVRSWRPKSTRGELGRGLQQSAAGC